MQKMTQQEFARAWGAAVQAAVRAGVHEVGGNNRGPQVDSYELAVGGELGESWCMDFIVFYALKVYCTLVLGLDVTAANVVEDLKEHWSGLTRDYGILVTGSCGAQMRYQALHGRVIYHDDITEIKENWLILYAWTAADVRSRIPHHVGMSDEDWQRGHSDDPPPVSDDEGNTGVGGDQSDGDGAAHKERSLGNIVCVIRTY